MQHIKYALCFLLVSTISFLTFGQQKIIYLIDKSLPQTSAKTFHSAENNLIQYTGRIQKEKGELPRFWAPGVYFKLRFTGNICKIFLNDEVLYGNVHNYIEIIVDDNKPKRLQLKAHSNAITIKGLKKGTHIITICKDTEAGNGYLEFAGINCEKLAKMPPKHNLKIEFIGNSITCGFGADTSEIGCGKGEWYDQHNAYMSYGPLTARALNAEWQLSAVSGIGLIHSCCKMEITMPQVYDKINMRSDSILWDFKNYNAGIVTICLGQNDGIQDSAAFCSTYVDFIKTVRSKYAKAKIILLTSPMGDAKLTAVLKKYITSVVLYVANNGDKNIDKYIFKKQYNKGCGSHPTISEHEEIANELTAFIRNNVE